MSDRLVPQASVIPVKDGKVCLITSANGKRWIVPKGMVDPGFTLEEAALQEAWEEAGLRGTILPEALGTYRYAKWGLNLEVTVFLMEVTVVMEEWPEAKIRCREWVSWQEAAQRLANEDLSQLVAQLGSGEIPLPGE